MRKEKAAGIEDESIFFILLLFFSFCFLELGIQQQWNRQDLGLLV